MSEESSEPIDWENPFEEIRSADIDLINVQFLHGGNKVKRLDDKGEEYIQYRFNCMRVGISNPSKIIYITSSKRLIEELQKNAPIKNKHFKIVRTGSGFQTKYEVTDITPKKKPK